MNLSIIIPTYNEEKILGQNLKALKELLCSDLSSLCPLAKSARKGVKYEIIVVDGGSEDQTLKIAKQYTPLVFISEKGRAKQMNFGARKAKGSLLLFLHADTRLTAGCLEMLRDIDKDKSIAGGRFDLEIEGKLSSLRIVAFFINLRSRLTKIYTGDQAIFIRKDIFFKLNGYPEMPLMEDLELSKEMKKTGKIACLKTKVITSGRRWEKKGIIRTVIFMSLIRFLYFLGVNPWRLKRFYLECR